MWTQHNNTQGFLLVSFTMTSKRSYWQIFNMIKKFVFRASLSWFIDNACCFELVLATLLLKGESYCWKRFCFWPSLAHQESFCSKPRTLLSSLYVHLTQCADLLSKHLEANFKHLLRMELAVDVIFWFFFWSDT